MSLTPQQEEAVNRYAAARGALELRQSLGLRAIGDDVQEEDAQLRAQQLREGFAGDPELSAGAEDLILAIDSDARERVRDAAAKVVRDLIRVTGGPE